MIELKGILKRNILHSEERELGDKLADILNDYCPSKNAWYYEGNRLIIEVNLEEQEELLKFIEDLVGCSYFSEYDEDIGVLTLSFTLSTLVEKLTPINEYGYEPVKMDRFIKYQNKDETPRSGRKNFVYVMDTRILVDEVFSKGYADNGIIFTAASPSEWVNHEIADKVLELLNTECSFTQMIENCIKKNNK